MAVEPPGHGELHGVLQAGAGASGFALGGWSQDCEAGIGTPGGSASGWLECVLNAVGEALTVEDRLEFDAHDQAPVERAIGRAAERGGQLRKADAANRHGILRVEREVPERGQVAEQIEREILRFLEDPNRQTGFFRGAVLDPFLDLPPAWCAPECGFESACPSAIAIPVEAREIGIGRIADAAAMRIQFRRDLTQGGGLADAGRSGQQSAAGWFEEPHKRLFQAGELAVVEAFAGGFAEWRLSQSERLRVPDHSCAFGLHRRA